MEFCGARLIPFSGTDAGGEGCQWADDGRWRNRTGQGTGQQIQGM